MSIFPTRRQVVHTLAGSTFYLGFLNKSAAQEISVTKKEFMRESLENITKNGGKFEPSTKMRFGAVPQVTPFVDWDYFYLEGPLLWMPNQGQDFATVTVPKGFVTDLASVPSGLWSVYPKTGRYAYAAIVHDYLYWDQSRSREEADKVLAAAMEDAKVPQLTIFNFVSVLKAAGGFAWDSNARAKASGEKRVLAKFPDDRLISWDNWKNQPGVFK
ncbi:hypothetical protein MPPM_5534 (plasmid) [Methylorubrum populi]|uniref:DUF1353 domain-containing protein n=1 Tax=Methylorubrum populi TaxID=223967 RepID=A0A160PKK7_9HYPH|nr:hypothetical protein MPPM_5534 [Methylorubrum populi]